MYKWQREHLKYHSRIKMKFQKQNYVMINKKKIKFTYIFCGSPLISQKKKQLSNNDVLIFYLMSYLVDKVCQLNRSYKVIEIFINIIEWERQIVLGELKG